MWWQRFLGRLRSWGAIGTTIASILVLLTASWAVAVSAAIGLIAALWAAARGVFENHNVQVGIGAFLASLWTYIGILYLLDRKNPRLVQPFQDYRYALTCEGILAFMDPKSPDIFLQFAIRLRNYGAAPVKCQITKADIRIEDRALPEYKKMKPSYLPRGGCKDMRLIPFKRSSLQEFFGKKQKGTAEFIIIYGHPEEPPVREMRVKAELHIALSDDGDNLGFVAGAVDERDISFVGDESSYD